MVAVIINQQESDRIKLFLKRKREQLYLFKHLKAKAKIFIIIVDVLVIEDEIKGIHKREFYKDQSEIME